MDHHAERKITRKSNSKVTNFDRPSDDEYEDGGDSLSIRPQQNRKSSHSKHKERDRISYEYNNDDQLENERQQYRHRHLAPSSSSTATSTSRNKQRRDDSHARPVHSSRRYTTTTSSITNTGRESTSDRYRNKSHKSRRRTKEKMKGDSVVECKHYDECKYDDENTKDTQNLNRDSEETQLELKSPQEMTTTNALTIKYQNEVDEECHVVSFLKDMESKSDNEYDYDYHDDADDSKCDEESSPKRFKSDFPLEESVSDERTRSAGHEDASESVSKAESSPVSPLLIEEPTDDIIEEEIVDKRELDETLPPYYPAIEGCRSVEEFQCLNRIEEGTYGVVYRFKDKRTDDIVALKKLKMEKEKEGFPITSLREINTLLKSQHPNIVTVREIVVGNNMDKIFIVMDYVEHDMKSLIEHMRVKQQKFLPGEVKCLLKQLLLAVAHLHDNWILHRDLKTSNLLLSHKGILKVGDFGLAREYGSPLKAYTPIVVTLWYRAPELLLGCKKYSTPIDMWSVGCIFAEFIQMHALVPGKTEVEQINRIYKLLGTPNDDVWPGYSQLPAVRKVKFLNNQNPHFKKKFQPLSVFTYNMLSSFLTYDPSRRVSAEDALKHSYFGEFPAAIDPSQFPKWPAKSEQGSHSKRTHVSSPKPPSGGGEFKKLGDEDGFRIDAEAENTRMGGGFNLKF